MSAQQNKVLIRRYLDALHRDKTTAIAHYVADEALQHHITATEAAFPGYQMVPEELLAEEDKVVLRATVQGTHRGELMGIQPTGKEIRIPAVMIYQLANGKIIDHWLLADQFGLMQQLGVIQASWAG